jgi:hypothetical protein
MEAVQDIRSYLEKALIQKHSDWLWSFDLSSQKAHISDKLIIQKYLEFGSQSEWKMLKKAFQIDQIKNIWISNLALGGLYESKQEKIAKSFFNIKNPLLYLERKRKAHLKNELARSY